MKHGKKPTLKQKKLLGKHKYRCENWLVIEERKEYLKIINKGSGRIITLCK